ncbi:hypothetical protein GWK08_00690 [Leptobacterium flavescens]|uniref:Histidyl-tRNA synthetase n=1 Tax=Leptobacterium flavescens TaxID=472055 RepID=A0A6P0ULL4_9FLAO|nr:DUF6495 family protein [Leptobacterium flavescens]NER11943.1 hypothetical protein [Leptobacterium flavescens]
MKYTRLSKEQFKALHKEFINFLATQSITAAEWDTIKKEKPEVAEQELDVFSDLIWEGVLSKVDFLENSSENSMLLFKCDAHQFNLIAVKINNKDINLLTDEGFHWFQENIMHEDVELFTASKVYSEDKRLDIFKLIQQGAQIADGTLFNALDKVVN